MSKQNSQLQILSEKLKSQYLPLWLFLRNTFKYRVYWRKTLSQLGQDYWVINEVFSHKKGGYFVEIGSADGLIINNTYLLEKRYGWSGICIEANPDYFKLLKLNRKCTCLNLCVDETEGEVDFVFSRLKGGILSEDTDNQSLEKMLIFKRLKQQLL